VKPETANCLAKAREALADAKTIEVTSVYRVAAREAYVAAFHATEAYVFERVGRVAKTHRGLRTLFSQASKGDPGVPLEFSAFLAGAFELKSLSDYGVDPTERITKEQASATIEMAERFVAIIEVLPK
jgi:uncharacterized protein (UPF0332 family)